MNEAEVIIVGGGPAGLSAGLYACRAGHHAVLLERMFAGGQITTTHMLENYPGFPQGISGVDIGMAMMEQAQRFGLQIEYDTVTEMDLTGDVKKVTTESGAWQAPVVILCMGSQRRLLGLPREGELLGRGVAYCATCDGIFYRGKVVAVVGGGDTACEDALYLSQLASKVILIHRRYQMRATAILQRRVEETANIDILWNTRIQELIGDDKLQGLVLEGDHQGAITVDGLFIAVGTEPQTDIVKGQVALDPTGCILTDAQMCTSLPGVYAAGDVRVTPLKQVVTAAADGAVAATEATKYLMEK